MTGTSLLLDARTRGRRACLSVVVPAYDESTGLVEFHRRMSKVLDALNMDSEIIFVNDGSCDDTLKVMKELRGRDPRIAVIDLSRNFGKEVAVTAGLDHASGDATVIIDADLQDPPELILKLLERWREGYDVIYATRTRRLGETWVKKLTAGLFYTLLGGVRTVTIPRNTGDFRVMSRRALEALLRLREHHRFMKGLYAWIGYKQIGVPYVRDARFAGDTKWNYWRLWNFAIEGLTSFTVLPLKVSTYLGVVTAAGALVYGLIIIARTLFMGRDVPGYPSIMAVVLFLGGVQLISLGVLGEYVGRMFNEVKRRPLYLLQEVLPSSVADRSVQPGAQTDTVVFDDTARVTPVEDKVASR